MATINCKVGEIDDILEELYESDIYVGEIELANKEIENGMILASEMYIIIPSLKASVREGTFCSYDEDSGECSPDFSITLIYEAEERDPDMFLCWEQDSISVALYNFFRDKGYSMESIYSADCVICYEEG